MKKIYLYIILIGIVSFGIIPRSVKAISLECPSIATQLEDVVCKIKTENSIGVKAKYEVDSIFNYLSFKVNSPWKNYYTGGLGFTLGNIVDNSNLDGEVSFKVGVEAVSGESYSIRLKEIEEVNNKNQNIKLEDITSNIKIVSNINTLSSIEIDNVKLSPKFDSNVMNYQVSTKKDKINIKASLTDARAKLEGDIGEKELKYGVNTFVIKVTSERGNVREYKIFVTRVKKNNDATLKSLIVNNKEIKLEKDKYYYEMSVDNSVTSLNIDATSSNNFSKIEISKPEKLVVGENIISVKVIAENGEECIYTINVSRKRKLSDDNTIKSLIIKNYDINFSSDRYNYEVVIENEKELDIEVILNNEFASYVVKGNKKLKNNSKIEIIVEAENGDKKTYTIKVFREVESNSNSVLSSIRLMPLISFIILILLILIVKKVRSKLLKNDSSK